MNLRERNTATIRTLVIGGFALATATGLSFAVDDPAGDATETELLRKLEERDAAIEDLLRRVEQLERQIATGATAQASTPPEAKTERAPAAPAVAAAATTAPTPAPEPAREQDTSPAQPAETQSAPGKFEVDEDAAERALERTLVQEGVLLLPLGVLDVQPSFAYTRNEERFPLSVIANEDGDLVTEKVRRDRYDAALQLRLGTPFDSQIEFRLPYRYVDQSEVLEVRAGSAGIEDRGHGSSLGDLRIGFAKTLLREGPWWPDLVARLSWDTDTGDKTDNGVILGGGFHEIIAQLSAVKRQDPLAFVGGLSYQKTFEKDDIKPGQELSLNLGVAIAASPETSLRFVVNQSFRDDTEIDNRTIDGSDFVDGRLTIGASSVVGNGVFLDVATDVGLTDDAPDYAVSFSLSKRFDLRPLF